MLEKLQHILSSSTILLPDFSLGFAFLAMVAYVSFEQNNGKTATLHFLTLGILILSGGFYLNQWNTQIDTLSKGMSLFHGLIYLDEKSIFIKLLVIGAGILVLFHLKLIGYRVASEFYVIFIALIWGLLLMSMTNHWLMLYIALELVSLSSYILVVFNKASLNQEAGIRYLLFGATASALMLYGVSLLYGMTGSLLFDGLAFTTYLNQNPSWIAALAMFLSISALIFKLSAAPFHFWTPDVYEVTPTPIVSFLSIAPKITALLVFIRITSSFQISLQISLAIIIFGSITIGNFSALRQNNTKRMLGYSTIAHGGFMLVGLLANNDIGLQATLFYATSYLFITLGAFLLIDLLALKTDSYQLESLKGLGQENVALGLAAVVIMIGLTGLPPTVGFSAKLLIFSALWESYQNTQQGYLLILLLFGLLNTAIALFYYIRIPFYMIFKEPSIGTKKIHIGNLRKTLLFFYVIAMVYLFIKPDILMDFIIRLL